MKHRYFPVFIVGLLLYGCAQQENIAEKVESAHGLDQWWQTDVLQVDMRLTFGKNPPLVGTLFFETNGPRARLDITNGPRIFYDGHTAYISPADAEFPRARFHVLTWPWFVAAPFKLRGTGSELTPFKQVVLQDETFWNARQSFAAGQGDTPDDWYEFYVDPKHSLVRQMGYIVTYERSRQEAEQNVSVIVYDDYIDLNGIQLAQQWTFGTFSLTDGFLKKKGEGRLRGIKFIFSGSDLFAVPQDKRELPKPRVDD